MELLRCSAENRFFPFQARLKKRIGFHMLRYMNAVIRCLTRSSG